MQPWLLPSAPANAFCFGDTQLMLLQQRETGAEAEVPRTCVRDGGRGRRRPYLSVVTFPSGHHTRAAVTACASGRCAGGGRGGCRIRAKATSRSPLRLDHSRAQGGGRCPESPARPVTRYSRVNACLDFTVGRAIFPELDGYELI